MAPPKSPAAPAQGGEKAWVTDLIEAHLDDAELERMWQEFYAAVHPARKNVKRAEALRERLTSSRRRKGAA